MDPSPLGSPVGTPEMPSPDAATPPRGRLRSRPSRLWGVVVAAAGGLLLAGCNLPDFGENKPITTQGQDSIKLWQGFFIAGLVVFLIVFALIAWASIRYHRRSDAIPRQTQYHTVLEIIYTALPIVAVLILFGFTFVTENNVDALPAPQLSVRVTAFQWGWRFHYIKQDVTVMGVELQDPEMVLPRDETIRIALHSNDVIHGFYVPAFDFSRYAQPGITNKFTVNLHTLGTYRGQCTQYCGLYHSLMRFRVKVVTPAQFTNWVHTHRSTATGTSGGGGSGS
ncbi:MAG: cytochrome c oxidase subunit II [Acidimicrobiales bacterium]